MDMASAVAEHVLGGEGPVIDPSKLKFLELIKKKGFACKEQPPKVYKDSDIEEFSKLQTRKYAKEALDHYNANMDGLEYELVGPVHSNAIVGAGFWFHVGFTARPISSDLEDDTSLKYFFAEVACPVGKKKSIFCVIVDPGSPDTIDGCRFCRHKGKIFHPKSGFEVGSCSSRGDDVVHPYAVVGRDIESKSG